MRKNIDDLLRTLPKRLRKQVKTVTVPLTKECIQRRKKLEKLSKMIDRAEKSALKSRWFYKRIIKDKMEYEKC